MLRPVDVPPVPEATAALAWRVHPRGTDEMRVRDALGPLFTDADFVSGPLAGLTITQVLSLAEAALSGNTGVLTPYGITVAQFTSILGSINGNYDNCTTNGGYLQ